MKKIFIVTGELSGDKLAAWYITKQCRTGHEFSVTAIGGDFIAATGATLYARMEQLNCVGIVEIVRHIPFLLRFMQQLIKHLQEHHYDEIVLVDFPGFNLRLAKKIKKMLSSTPIIYLSPPQLWIWGAWRIKTLQRICSKIIVIYPFEVAWYRARGVHVEWWGYPLFDELSAAMPVHPVKEEMVALMVGSRNAELTMLLPLYQQILAQLKAHAPHLKILIPRAESISRAVLDVQLKRHGFDVYSNDIVIIDGSAQAKYEALARCAFALSKPGTVTLELALLGVPTIVMYKTSWMTYIIARCLVTIRSMALPNLLLNRVVFQEFIQHNCIPTHIAQAACALYDGYQTNNAWYQFQCAQLHAMRQVLENAPVFALKNAI